MRVFDSALASYVTETIPGVSILSMSRVTAPVFGRGSVEAVVGPANKAFGDAFVRSLAASLSRRPHSNLGFDQPFCAGVSVGMAVSRMRLTAATLTRFTVDDGDDGRLWRHCAEGREDGASSSWHGADAFGRRLYRGAVCPVVRPGISRRLMCCKEERG